MVIIIISEKFSDDYLLLRDYFDHVEILTLILRFKIIHSCIYTGVCKCYCMYK